MANADFEKFFLGNGAPDRNPITAFNFVLEVEAVYFLPLKSVHAFTKKNDYEKIREGGLNDYVHLRRKQVTEPFTFQVERYIGTDRFLDPIANGTELLLPLILHVYRHKAMQGFGSGNTPDAWPARLFIFTGCQVISKEYGELNAEKSALMTETTTIAYRELMVINNSLTDVIKQLGFDATALSAEQKEWRFKEASEKKADAFKDPESGRNHAARAANDSQRATVTAWSFTDDKGNPKDAKDMRKPVRARQAENSDKRAESVKWDLVDKDGKAKSAEDLKPVRGRQAGNSDDRAENVKWDLVGKDGQLKPKEDRKPVRGQQAGNSDKRADPVEWSMGDDKSRGQLADNSDDRAESVLWEMTDDEGQLKPKEDRKPLRGKQAANSDKRAEVVTWTMPKEGEDLKPGRGRQADNSGDRAESVAWSMGDDPSRGQLADNSDERAEVVTWTMPKDGEDLKPTRGKLADNSKDRAKAVKWPPDRRAMTVDLLNR